MRFRLFDQTWKKRYILFGLTMLIIAGGLALHKLLNQPATGTVRNQQPTIASTETTTINVRGRYISFSYPAIFSVTATDKLGGAELEVFEYIKKPSPFYFLNITVSSLRSGKLTNDSSYSLRQTETDRYSSQQWPINGQPVTIFSDNTQAYSKAGFLAHDDIDASVALTANTTDSNLDQILLTVLRSLHWN